MVPPRPVSTLGRFVAIKSSGSSGDIQMQGRPTGRGGSVQRVASFLLVLFVIAILLALAITLSSVPVPVRILAGSVVSPIIALGIVFLLLDLRGLPWSFLGAAILGCVGIALRLIINAQPQLEVGGGLPIAVTIGYLVLGIAVTLSSLWAYRASRQTSS
jgi:hypothetical protein